MTDTCSRFARYIRETSGGTLSPSVEGTGGGCTALRVDAPHASLAWDGERYPHVLITDDNFGTDFGSLIGHPSFVAVLFTGPDEDGVVIDEGEEVGEVLGYWYTDTDPEPADGTDYMSAATTIVGALS